jgi:arginase
MTTTSMIQPKFLTRPSELGVVAVGFSGGQVRFLLHLLISHPLHPHHHQAPPSNLPQCKPGVDAAPSALIKSGLLTQLHEELGYDLHHDDTVHSYKELIPTSDPSHRGMKNPRAVSAVTQRLCAQVYAHAIEGRCVLTLGGDHSIAIGSVAGTARAVRERLGREMALIWVDAHADINTPETSGSGNIHGMPVAFLTGLAREEEPEMFGWVEEDMRVSLRKIVYIGLRDVDRGEKAILREHGVKAFSMHDIDRYVPSIPCTPKSGS